MDQKHLKLVSSVPSIDLDPHEHDMSLPNLGKLYFVMRADDFEGVLLIYVKKSKMDVIPGSNGEEACGITKEPYCYTHVKLNGWDQFVGMTLEKKIQSKLRKLKQFLIDEDTMIGHTKLTARYIDV